MDVVAPGASSLALSLRCQRKEGSPTTYRLWCAPGTIARQTNWRQLGIFSTATTTNAAAASARNLTIHVAVASCHLLHAAKKPSLMAGKGDGAVVYIVRRGAFPHPSRVILRGHWLLQVYVYSAIDIGAELAHYAIPAPKTRRANEVSPAVNQQRYETQSPTDIRSLRKRGKQKLIYFAC